MDVSPEDIRALIRDKYDGDKDADLREDLARLSSGEPLAYVIGWIPFLGCRIELASRPLIPRVETEFWADRMIAHLKERFGDRPFSLLDLCAGSGAIGIAVLKHIPSAYVSFAEIDPAHVEQIRANLLLAGVADRAEVRAGDLFAPFADTRFDVIATNPPYVPSERTLEKSVAVFEPSIALFAGTDGLSVIEQLLTDAPRHLTEGGEVWLECDSTHADAVRECARAHGAVTSAINEDQYGRPRYVVSYYP